MPFKEDKEESTEKFEKKEEKEVRLFSIIFYLKKNFKDIILIFSREKGRCIES